jgi:hypothetical protein
MAANLLIKRRAGVCSGSTLYKITAVNFYKICPDLALTK